jgi:hypothetical protein
MAASESVDSVRRSTDLLMADQDDGEVLYVECERVASTGLPNALGRRRRWRSPEKDLQNGRKTTP